MSRFFLILWLVTFSIVGFVAASFAVGYVGYDIGKLILERMDKDSL